MKRGAALRPDRPQNMAVREGGDLQPAGLQRVDGVAVDVLVEGGDKEVAGTGHLRRYRHGQLVPFFEYTGVDDIGFRGLTDQVEPFAETWMVLAAPQSA